MDISKYYLLCFLFYFSTCHLFIYKYLLIVEKLNLEKYVLIPKLK